MRMVLVGPHAGKDITLGGFRFIGGACDVPSNAEAAVRILGGYYSAFPAGSKELEDAQAAWNAKHPPAETAAGDKPPSTTSAPSSAPSAPVPDAETKGKKR